MSELEYRNRFCRSMVAAATDAVVVDRLLGPASETSLDKHSKYTIGVSPSLATASRIRKVPSRWAEKLAGAVDMSAPDAGEVLELISKDPRLGVRRALVKHVKDLPIEVLDELVTSAMAGEDSELFELAFTHQNPPAGHVVSWVCSEDAMNVALSPAGEVAMAKLVLTDFDAAVEVVSRCRIQSWAAAVLSSAVSGDVHFVDIVNTLGSELPHQRVQCALDLMEPNLPDMDVRMVEWLSEHAVDRFSVLPSRNLLCHLKDPELIAAWWRSGISGARANLFAKHTTTSPAVAATVAALPGVSDDVDLATFAVLGMCGTSHKALSRRVLSHNLKKATSLAETAAAAISIMEGVGFIPRSEQSEDVVLAFDAIAGVLHGTAVFAALPEFAPLFVRLAALCPQVVGPLLLWQEDPVPGLVDRVAENPELFGVTGHHVLSAVDGSEGVGRPAVQDKGWEPWKTCPELWSLLLWNTPGVIEQVATQWAERPKIDGPVFELLAGALGHSEEGWDTVLSLVPSWEGSVAELVGVASTFIDDVVTDAPVRAETVDVPDSGLPVAAPSDDPVSEESAVAVDCEAALAPDEGAGVAVELSADPVDTSSAEASASGVSVGSEPAPGEQLALLL